ncbi:hypothetical protein SAMN04489760_11334 [Syntrophus gentianae]|uniref:Lipoprotein n=1 Tax=Syntrophus gentianae TaxID=43775 RepID=A0A1H7Y0A0_9BACT|nr:hypothetical protein [Syntrophus gentianae]SEM39391.1 hypothetical protein SAMN04489760_11334 [Syntrophus gentianae]
MKFSCWLPIILFVLLTACAAPQVPLTAQARASIQSVESVLIVPEESLTIDVKSSGSPLGPGLIPDLMAVIATRSKLSEAKLSAIPILQQLKEYNFRAVLQNAFAEEAAKLKPPFGPPTRLEINDVASGKKVSFSESRAGLVMFTIIDYRLESGSLIINALVEMIPKADPLMQYRHSANNSDPLDEGNVIYRKTFTHTKEFITARNVRKNLTDGATSIARQIFTDLNQTP